MNLRGVVFTLLIRHSHFEENNSLTECSPKSASQARRMTVSVVWNHTTQLKTRVKVSYASVVLRNWSKLKLFSDHITPRSAARRQEGPENRSRRILPSFDLSFLIFQKPGDPESASN